MADTASRTSSSTFFPKWKTEAFPMKWSTRSWCRIHAIGSSFVKSAFWWVGEKTHLSRKSAFLWMVVFGFVSCAWNNTWIDHGKDSTQLAPVLLKARFWWVGEKRIDLEKCVFGGWKCVFVNCAWKIYNVFFPQK